MSGVIKRESNQFLVLFALWLLVFSASSQLMIVVAMLPVIGKQLQIPEAGQGWLVSVYALMVGLFALVIGPVSDKFGRRRVLLIGAGLMTGALALHAVAVDFTTLLIVRLLAGIAGGTLSGAAVSYVGDYFPDERRGWANGWVMSGIAVGQIAGVPLGTLLADWYGFRTPFLLFAATMGATFLLVWKFVPQPDVPLLEEKLTLKSALGSYWQLLHRADVRAAAAAFFVMFLSMALFVIYLPAWLTAERSATSKQIAALFFVGGIASVLTGPVAGRASDRTGRKKIIIGSCLALAATMCVFTTVVQTFWMVYPIFFLIMILLAARMTPFQALLSGLVTGEHRGTLMSLTVSIGQIGFAFGGSVVGLIYSNFGYSSSTITGAAMVLTMALLVWRFIPETVNSQSKSEPHTSLEKSIHASISNIGH